MVKFVYLQRFYSTSKWHINRECSHRLYNSIFPNWQYTLLLRNNKINQERWTEIMFPKKINRKWLERAKVTKIAVCLHQWYYFIPNTNSGIWRHHLDGASNYGWGREQDLRYTSIMSYCLFFQISTLDFSLNLCRSARNYYFRKKRAN